MKALTDQIKLQKEIYIIGLFAIIGMYMVGTIIYAIILSADGEQSEVLCMGSMLAGMGIGLTLLFGVTAHMVNVFNYAISLGRTRRAFFPAYTMAVFVTAVVLEAVLVILHFVERTRLGLMYPNLRIDDPVAGMLHWNILLVIALVGTAFSVFFATLIVRFGKTALWALCLLWAACWIGLPRLIVVLFDHLESDVSKAVFRAVEWFFGLGDAALPAIALCVAAIALSASYLLIRRQQVNL